MEPILLMSELDNNRYEVRKIEIFADGRMEFASNETATGETALGEKPIPPAYEIVADPQFIVEEFNAVDFEEAWHTATTR